MTRLYLFTFLLVLLVLVFSANGNAQAPSVPLRFDPEVMEMVKIVTKNPENFRNRSAFTLSRQLKPAREVWIRWEQIKASEKSSQKAVNADTPVAELKILAEKGNQDAVIFLREYLRRLTVDENTSETMLRELVKVGHKESLRILQEQKNAQERQKAEQEAKRKAVEEQKRQQEEWKKIEEARTRLAKEKEEALKRQEEEARLKRQKENETVSPKVQNVSREKENPETAKVTNLDEAMKESGFWSNNDGSWFDHRYESDLKDFVYYGNAELQVELEEAQSDVENASPFDKANAQKKVDTVRTKIGKVLKEIASKTFFKEYSYQVNGVKLLGNERSMFTMDIKTNYIISKFGGGTFPMQGVTGRLSEGWSGHSNFSIRGDADSIQELVQNNGNYKAKIQFKNLRAAKYRFDNPYADVIRIDVVKK